MERLTLLFGWLGWEVGGRCVECGACFFTVAVCAGAGVRFAIARRENDTWRLKLLFAGQRRGRDVRESVELVVLRLVRARGGCAIGYFAPRRIVGTRKATFRRVCVARSALI